MSQIAKLFLNGRSQAVRLPAAFRFDAKEVFVRLDAETGDVILSRKPSDWASFFEAARGLNVPSDFLSASERAQSATVEAGCDPFAQWQE
jgi:antitoxin VapB